MRLFLRLCMRLWLRLVRRMDRRMADAWILWNSVRLHLRLWLDATIDAWPDSSSSELQIETHQRPCARFAVLFFILQLTPSI